MTTTDNIKVKTKSINPTVFDSFKKFTSENDVERCNGILSLLQHFNRNHSEQEDTKERDYVLTRLIRGLGASTFSSRVGFFTAFVGFLGIPQNEIITQQQIVEVLQKQLYIGKGVNDKENSDAAIGHILLCGALIRAKRTSNANILDIAQCVQILVEASKYRIFHASMAYSFLVDLLNELSVEQFTEAMWPVMQKELQRSWEKHTCNTIWFLLLAHRKYPDLVDETFLQSSIRTTEILTPLAYKHLGRIFWGSTSITTITHPSYEALSQFLTSVKRKQLTDFWTTEINEIIAAPNAVKEFVTLKVLVTLLHNIGDSASDAKMLLKLITPRFIKMVMSSLKGMNQQKHKAIQAQYNEFFEAIHTFFGVMSDDEVKVEILKKFILHPGMLLMEKYLKQKIVHQLILKLGPNGVIALFDVYKSILLTSIPKDPRDTQVTWLNVERHHAAQMMHNLLGQKCVQPDITWRSDQLKFLLTISLFHVSETGDLAKKDHASDLITKDIALHIKTLFYTSLQMKSSNLKDEKRILFALVEYTNSVLSKKNAAKYQKIPLPETALSSWSQMFDSIQSTHKEDKKLKLTFHILLLHMGLQLFREPDIAQLAIADLVKCMEKTEKLKQRKSISGDGGDHEPDWIEVVVDLFLQLLSQNTSFLRNVVCNVFPPLCSKLTLTAVHQILSMLDMRSGKNPLSVANAEDADNDSDEEMNSESGDDDDDGSDEEDDEDEDGDSEPAVSDQLRNAVSTALGSTVIDTDVESIDLNDMDEQEAEKLDEALSSAFQLLRKANGKSGSNKKSKKERSINVTVMHFRSRVLDLIEIYLKTSPVLSIVLEIIVPLFNMLECCTTEYLKPLFNTVDRVLKKLLALRQFSNTEDVTSENLQDLMKTLLEAKVNPIILNTHSQLLSKSVAFLISCSQLLNETTSETSQSLLTLLVAYSTEFIKSRNPIITYSLLQDIFNMRWNGVWHLAKCLSENCLAASATTRSFRRLQILVLLTLMYKNHGFIASDGPAFNKFNKAIVKSIESYVAERNDGQAFSSKEFSALVNLLLEMKKCNKLLAITAVANWKVIGEHLQQIEQNTGSATGPPGYRILCESLGLKYFKKSGQSNGVVDVNSKKSTEEDDDTHTPQVIGKKRKLKVKASNSVGDIKRQKKIK